MNVPEQLLADVSAAVELASIGEQAQARARLERPWQQVGTTGDALHRTAVAHALADVQDLARDELLGDEGALAAAAFVTDERTHRAGMPGPAASLLPCLHLNLGEVHHRLGDLTAAREQVALGQAAAAALGSDGYGAVVRRCLDALAERLAQS